MEDLIGVCDRLWPAEVTVERAGLPQRWVVLTGGEPLLQLTIEHMAALHTAGFLIAVETNGSVKADINVYRAINWLTVSPKKGMAVDPHCLHHADEVKVVLPGGGNGHGPWTDAELLEFELSTPRAAHYVQPQDATDPKFVEVSHLSKVYAGLNDAVGATVYQPHVQRCIDFVHVHESWRLSVQTHKYLGLR